MPVAGGGGADVVLPACVRGQLGLPRPPTLLPSFPRSVLGARCSGSLPSLSASTSPLASLPVDAAALSPSLNKHPSGPNAVPAPRCPSPAHSWARVSRAVWAPCSSLPPARPLLAHGCVCPALPWKVPLRGQSPRRVCGPFRSTPASSPPRPEPSCPFSAQLRVCSLTLLFLGILSWGPSLS